MGKAQSGRLMDPPPPICVRLCFWKRFRVSAHLSISGSVEARFVCLPVKPGVNLYDRTVCVSACVACQRTLARCAFLSATWVTYCYRRRSRSAAPSHNRYSPALCLSKPALSVRVPRLWTAPPPLPPVVCRGTTRRPPSVSQYQSNLRVSCAVPCMCR